MYADRHSRSGGFNPGSLAIALTINATLVAGLILSVPEFRAPLDHVLQTRNIPIDEPPPPKPLPQPEPRIAHQSQRTIQHIDTLKPLVDTNTASGPFVFPPQPPFDPGMDAAGTTIIDPPVKPPVLSDATVDPRYARDFQPEYPAGERRMGNEGKVVIRVLIGSDGRVKQVERVSAASESFWQATKRQALSRWRFRPALLDGAPVESWRIMTVRFEMTS
ncbi:MAG: energy transducer TonB [Candidatus Sphingomonas colombiensis]|nr:energy transducer TonB [Sphingomonas sp.]WEK44469.1 MAG: energy transducer TonB [Sphingomonas sp.]